MLGLHITPHIHVYVQIVEVYECLTRTAVEGFMEFCAGCRGRARRRSGKTTASSGTAATAVSVSLNHHSSQSEPLSFMSSTQVISTSPSHTHTHTHTLSLSLTQLDLIDMSPHRDGQYQWIGHFTDHWSCFHILFPLVTISADEVALNLCRYVYQCIHDVYNSDIS